MGEEHRYRRYGPTVQTRLPPLLTRAHAELFVFCLLLANMFQATIAIRSPPAPYSPLQSPSKSLSPRSKGGQQQQHRAKLTPPAWRGKSGGLSPKVRLIPSLHIHVFMVIYTRANMQTTPQRQLAFSTTTPAGSSNPLSASAGAGGASDPRGLAQSYKLTFPNHHTSPPDISISSSTGSSSLPPSPSPAHATSPLAAYRGRRAPTGRASL